MDEDNLCEYCGEAILTEGFSIPLNRACSKWSGFFCSRRCRLSANRYVPDFPRRPLQEWTLREEWIRTIDVREGAGVVAYAPEPHSLYRYNTTTGQTRAQWFPRYNMVSKIHY